jgi:AraC-like DNA-binding protein
MAYDHVVLFNSVCAALQRTPLIRLSELSCQLKIERHTIEKVVRAESGQSFRVLRKRMLFDAARHLLELGPNCSIKEIAFSLGYRSPRSFARFIRGVSAQTPSALQRSHAGKKAIK